MKLKAVTSGTPEESLEELGLELPPVPEAVADYVTHSQIGRIIYTSGMLPWIAGDLKFKGKMGAELTVEQGYEAFQLSALNGLSLLRSITGDFGRIKRILGLGRLRLRGPCGANDEFLLAATAQNLRKLAKIFPAPQQMRKA
ncbi:MAG: RidA family protein [Pseudomonadota bacterium]